MKNGWLSVSPALKVDAILFVTHDLGEAVTLADRILLMGGNSGRIQSDIPVHLPRARKRESRAFHDFYRDLRNRL